LIFLRAGAKSKTVTEILNYISAWVTLLAAMLGLCVFLFERASKKKSFLAARIAARDIKKNLKMFHLEQKRFFLLSHSESWQ
jgi:hypothetical protein